MAKQFAPLSAWSRRQFLSSLVGALAFNVLPPLLSRSQRPQLMADSNGGLFGRWITDAMGLPAYRYELDQYADERAQYPNSENRDRRDHWHQIGNFRVTALASNDGTVQVYKADRGGSYLNRFEADYPDFTHKYAGGFGYIDDGDSVWATAFRYRPEDSHTERIFGMGYVEGTTIHRNIRTMRRVYAPFGDAPFFLADIEIENLGDSPAQLRYYEYWDVNVHQLMAQWWRTGDFAWRGDSERRSINDSFVPSILWAENALRFSQTPKANDELPPPDQADRIDWYPADVFLADLSGTPDAWYVDKAEFFGAGGAFTPDAVAQRLAGGSIPAATSSMPYCMVLRRDLTLAPGEKRQLRFAYGSLLQDEPLSVLQSYISGDPFTDTVQAWRNAVIQLDNIDDPALSREASWHSYNLLSAAVYSEYYETFRIPQGSVYLYIHGADGAPRDQSLFTLPLTYVRPELAKETLRFLMRLMESETGALPYTFSGHGMHPPVSIHTKPSDLDLFFLLAITEYMFATADTAFLAEDVPFYPPGTRSQWVDGTSVLDHIRVAVRHLLEVIGIGENGLIKMGDGDWSDGIVGETAYVLEGNFYTIIENNRQNAESVPNTQMALYILPRVASLLETTDPELAAQLNALIPGLKTAHAAQWNGRWYNRAILRDIDNKQLTVGEDEIDLEAQVWALISGAAAEEGTERTLIRSIRTYLDDPSPIGATLKAKGMVWAAIAQLLTWGYTRSVPDLAWRSFVRQSFATHTAVFPDLWMGIWSGPDGINGIEAENPGNTWTSAFTPAIDFPVMNANPNAMSLLATIRLAGIEPAIDGIHIAPHRTPLSLDTALLRVDATPNSISGEYRAANDGAVSLRIHGPVSSVVGLRVSLNGQSTTAFEIENNQVVLPIEFTRGERVAFEVKWM
jgi:hypothetical protein